MTSNQTITALLEHETFVRSLARSLVGDHALADDLAQDTWVTALRHPPSTESSPRGWFAEVMRNRLRNLRRGEARRAHREAAVARSEVDDRSAALCERLDLQHRVVQAVLALPKTYRSTLLLHFFDGLTAADIARQRGVPDATVRSQLKRGLDQVREQLDRDQPGGRKAWCAMLLGFEREEVTATGSAFGSYSILGWGLATCCALALLIFFFATGDAPVVEHNPPIVTELAEKSADMAGTDPIRASEPIVVSRTAVPELPDRVVVVCKDELGRPVKNAEVFVMQVAKHAEMKGRYELFGPFTSNAKGRALGPPAMTFDGGKYDRLVYARVPGTYIGVSRSLRWTTEDDSETSIEVKLVAARKVKGKVKVPEGFDVCAVTVRVHAFYTPGWPETGGTFPRNSRFPGIQHLWPERFEFHPSPDGTFEFMDMPVGGRVYLMAEAPGLGQAQYANVGRGKIPIADLVVIPMEKERIIEGLVIGLPGITENEAQVSILPISGKVRVHLPFESTTTALGEFRIVGLPAADTYEVSVTANDSRLAFRPRRFTIEDGATTRLELRLGRSVHVAGEVVDADTGKGIADVWVVAIEPHEYGSRPRLGSCRTDSKGRFALNLPTGSVAVYLMGRPAAYNSPKPPIKKTFEITEGGAPAEDLRFTLVRSSKK